MNGNGRFMPMGDGPDDVLWSERSITAKEDLRQCRLVGFGIHHRTVLVIKAQTEITFDPWKRGVLANGKNDVLAGQINVRLAAGHRVPLLFVIVGLLEFLKAYGFELAAFDDK